MKKEELINLVFEKLPKSRKPKITDIFRSNDSIYFSWGNEEFKLSPNLMVEQVSDTHFLIGSDAALLIETLLRK